MRSDRPGPVLIDLPFDVQMAEIEFDAETYEPLPVSKPRATRGADRQGAGDAAGGRASADRRGRRESSTPTPATCWSSSPKLTGVPVIPTLMGWGAIPDDHPLMVGHGWAADRHRYGNATMLASDFVFGIGNRWANRHTGGRRLHQGAQVRAHRHRADPDRPRVHARFRHRLGRQGGARSLRRSRARAKASGGLRDRSGLGRANAASASARCCAARISRRRRSSRSASTRR